MRKSSRTVSIYQEVLINAGYSNRLKHQTKDQEKTVQNSTKSTLFGLIPLIVPRNRQFFPELDWQAIPTTPQAA